MSEPQATRLANRGLLEVRGADAATFLQGLITSDVTELAPERTLWGAFLTPQGKFLHEFFLSLAPEDDAAIRLEGEAARLEDLKTRLSRYRLRSVVSLELRPELAVVALFGDAALARLELAPQAGRARGLTGGIAFVDPRLAALGARAYLPAESAAQDLEAAGFTSASSADYDRHRIALGIPDGSRDLEVERSILLENGFDELGGIAWDKGCFLGQELTARTRYRGLIKKRLVPVTCADQAPAPGTAVILNGKQVGVLRSSAGAQALALLRLEALGDQGGEGLSAAGTPLAVQKPSWVSF
jgi:folate-binding protein YgfZ